MSFQKRCPAGTNKIMTMVEGGMGTDEIAIALQEMAEMKEIERTEGATEGAKKMESFPDEIRIISQALAFRGLESEDEIDSLHGVLTAAYSEEVSGVEKFRIGETMSKEYLMSLYQDKSYQWLIVEAPNGQGVEADGAVLGVCCYSTDGVSRKNGEIEGRLGVIRLLGILPRYHGLCIGNRLLKRAERAMLGAGCVRSMVCVASPRVTMRDWIERRGYFLGGKSPYPTKSIGHDLIVGERTREVELLMYLRPLAPVIVDGVGGGSVGVGGVGVGGGSGGSVFRVGAVIDADVASGSSGADVDGRNGESPPKNKDSTTKTDESTTITEESTDTTDESNDHTRSGVKHEGMRNKQNMSLPPHWRQQQPVIDTVD